MAEYTVKDVLNRFNPKRTLLDYELDAYYISRPHAPLEKMKAFLLSNEEPVKVLFSGHRGSGKSTELRRLAKGLETHFYIVPFSVAGMLNMADLKYADVVLACAVALIRKVIEDGNFVTLDDKLQQNLYDFLTNEITKETTIATTTSGNISAKLTQLILSIEAKYGKEATTRETMRQKLFPRLTDLIDRVNSVCVAIKSKTERLPLIVVEDLDKALLTDTRTLFFDNAVALNSLGCHVIYTFPIALCYSTQFPPRKRDYDNHFSLHNININQHALHNEPDTDGRNKLREVVTRRVQSELFAGNALDTIIDLSGGLMRDLVRIVRKSALNAITANSPVITVEMAQQVGAELGDDYRRILLPAHYEALRTAHRSKEIVPNETVQQLLENLSLLEYHDDAVWCDVHPVVLPLLT